MDPIATTEDAILAAAQAALGATVRTVEAVPGGWTMETLQRALQRAPGVYVAFQGATPGTAQGYLNGRFTVYCVTKGADESARRRGTPRVIGAYDLIAQLAPLLGGLPVADVGTLALAGIDNLFRDAMFDLGGTVYGIQLSLPNMPFDYQADLTVLSDFVLWHADHYNPGGIATGEAPLATDEVQL
jgi:phage gp37-like protein